MNDVDFGAALRRRLYPNTALHPKQLAHALGWDEPQNVYNHMNGKNRPGHRAVDAYIRFFVSSGDYSFVAEIYPACAVLVTKLRVAEEIIDAVRGASPETAASGADATAAPGGGVSAAGSLSRRTVPRAAA